MRASRSFVAALRRPNQRKFRATLFSLTFVAATVTVSASNILPCPVRPEKERWLDASGQYSNAENMSQMKVAVVPQKKRRWIEEKLPENNISASS
jgi:cytochrome c oxidase assembly factor 2